MRRGPHQPKTECPYSARIMLQDLAGIKKMTWGHDEHIITICGTENDITPKLMFTYYSSLQFFSPVLLVS